MSLRTRSWKLWWFEWELSPHLHISCSIWTLGQLLILSGEGHGIFRRYKSNGDVSHWGGHCVFTAGPQFWFCFLCFVENVCAELPALAAMSAACCYASWPLWTHPSWTVNPNILFLLYKTVAFVCVLITLTEKELKQKLNAFFHCRETWQIPCHSLWEERWIHRDLNVE